MARLPQPHSDDGVWGGILNDFLSVEFNVDGSLKRGADITAAQTAASAAQSSADSKYTKPSNGIPETDLSASAQASLAAANGILADGSVTNAKVASSAAIDQSKINGLTTSLTAKVDKATLTSKGDIYAASSSATPGRVSVGSNGQVLTADSTQTAGVAWKEPVQPLIISGNAAVPGGTKPTFVIRTP